MKSIHRIGETFPLRLSAWHSAGIAVIGLSLTALSLVGGAFVGYQWGRANGLAAAVAQYAGSEPSEVPFQLFGADAPSQLSQARPYLGVEFETITLELALAESIPVQQGAVIRSVISGSPADKAGLQAGDIIRAVNQEPIDARHTLQLRLARYQAGDRVTLTIVREGESQELRVTLGSPPVGTTFEISSLLANPRPEFRRYCSPGSGPLDLLPIRKL
jgi:membrane-associated protease RseP (regulator of RpoE activity)